MPAVTLNLRVFAGLTSLEVNRVYVQAICGLGGLHLQLKRLEFRAELGNVKDLFVETLERDKIKVNFEVFWKSLEILNLKGNLIDRMDDIFLYRLALSFFFFFWSPSSPFPSLSQDTSKDSEFSI